MSDQSKRVVLRDYPVALWLFGAVWLAVLAFMMGTARLPTGPQGWVGVIIAAVVGLAPLVLVGALVVTLDSAQGKLTLDYYALFRRSHKELALNEIASVEVDQSTSRRRGRTSRTYRVVLRLTSGKDVPLRSYYSSGSGGKEKQAQILRECLGVGGHDHTPVASFQAVQQIMQDSFRPQQTGTTQNVVWRVEATQASGRTVTRWCSENFKFEGQFLLLAQKPRSSGGGWMGGLLEGMAQTIYQPLLMLYGFGPDHTPGLGAARPLDALDASLEPYFGTLTSDAAAARQVLTPWAVTPLAQWAEQHPLKTFQTGDQPGQLVALFSPLGVYVALLGQGTEAQIEALTQLGVDLVRAQGA